MLMILFHGIDPDREKTVLERTMKGLEMSEKYQKLASDVKKEVSEIISEISCNTGEIFYRFIRNKISRDGSLNNYDREDQLSDFEDDADKLYNGLASHLNITTKHLFHLIDYADNEYESHANINTQYSNKSIKTDEDIIDLVRRLSYRLRDTKKSIAVDYVDLRHGQYPHLN